MKKIGKVISFILVIYWMVVVFKYSNEPADLSDHTSLNITKRIVEIVKKDTISDEEKQELIDEIDPIVRKFAHFILYSIGGLLIMLHLSTYNISLYTKCVCGTVIGSIYAITDEIHQIFIPGRAGEITDVLLDSIGIITGIIFIYLFVKKYNNKKINEEKT